MRQSMTQARAHSSNRGSVATHKATQHATTMPVTARNNVSTIIIWQSPGSQWACTCLELNNAWQQVWSVSRVLCAGSSYLQYHSRACSRRNGQPQVR